uniref:Autophagy-related protein n=1 Tax=viral metagenome TaxID=1070528 RepID=A0A6C0ES27_9ZZZZ
MSYKNKISLQERKDEVNRVLEKYPDRIPIICEKNIKSKNTPEIDKNKYLVPNDLTVGQFLYVIRKRLKIGSDKALFLFINGFIPSSASFISSIYDQYKDEDGYLYILYSFENVFG